MNDRAARARNLLFHGVPENNSRNSGERISHDKELTITIISALDPDIDCKNLKVVIIGKHDKNKVRPIKTIFNNDQDARIVFEKFLEGRLSELDDTLANVKISKDRTPQERKYINDLRSELAKQTDSGEEGLTIKYRNGVPTFVVKDAAIKRIKSNTSVCFYYQNVNGLRTKLRELIESLCICVYKITYLQKPIWHRI